MSNLWEVHDEVVRVRLLCSSDDVRHRDPRSTVAYVLRDGGGKQYRLLLYYPNQRAQPLDVQAFDVMTIQRHLRQRGLDL